jgi:hypothetical protein
MREDTRDGLRSVDRATHCDGLLRNHASHAPMDTQREPTFLQALAETLVVRAVPGVSADEADDAARFAVQRLACAPSVTALGMTAVGRALGGQARLVGRRSFAGMEPAQRDRWVSRWSSLRLPGVADYLDAVTGLAITRIYERRAA